MKEAAMSHPDVWRSGDPPTAEIAELERRLNLLWRDLETNGALSQDSETGAWTLDESKIPTLPLITAPIQIQETPVIETAPQTSRLADSHRRVALRPALSPR